MSHHASGPNFGFPRRDARLDMTDLYAFTKPGDSSKSIIVLNAHPSFRLDSREPTTREPFAPGALYDFKIGCYQTIFPITRVSRSAFRTTAGH